MNAIDAIRFSLELNRQILNSYLSDLSDADLLVRPAPAANHIAWQIGHLLSSEVSLLKDVVPNYKSPVLPAGFAEQHSKETAHATDTSGFKSKAEYVTQLENVRNATFAALNSLAEADLDKPSNMDFAPTVGKLLIMIASHDMMHAGQFAVLRRQLGKPVLI